MVNRPIQNTGPDESVNRAQSVRGEYNAVAHELHLPRIEDLPTQQMRNVMETLARDIAAFRDETVDLLALTNELHQQYTAHNKRPSTGVQNTPGGVNGVAEAEVLLNVIWNNYRPQEINKRFKANPLSIIPINARNADVFEDKNWERLNFLIPAPPAIGGVSHTLVINLNHQFWQQTRDHIRQNLAGQLPSQIGVQIIETAAPHAPVDVPFTPDMVTELFAQVPQSPIVNPRRALKVETIRGVPHATDNVLVDIPAIIRQNPAVATMDAAGLIAYLNGADPRGTSSWQRHVRSNSASVTDVVNALFRQMKRSPGQPLAADTFSLDSALANRDRINRLMVETVDSRELLLALAALQQNPDAIDAAQGSTQADNLRQKRELLERERNLSQSLAKLEQLKKARTTRAQIDLEITNIQNALPGMGKGAASAAEKRLEKLHAERENVDALMESMNQIVDAIRTIPSLANLLAAGGALHNYTTPATLEAAITNAAFAPGLIVQQVKSVFNATQAQDKSRFLSTVADYDARIQENTDESKKQAPDTGLVGSEACWAVIKRGLYLDGVRGPKLEKMIEDMRERAQESPDAARASEELAEAAIPFDGIPNKEAKKQWNAKHENVTRYRLNAQEATKIGMAAIPGAYAGWAAATFVPSLPWMGAWAAAGMWPIALGVGGGLATYYGAKKLLNRAAPTKEEAWDIYRKRLFPFLKIDLKQDPYQIEDTGALITSYRRLRYLDEYVDDANAHLKLPESVEIQSYLRRMHAAIIDRTYEKATAGHSDPQINALLADYSKKDPKQILKLSAMDKKELVQRSLEDESYYTDVVKADILKIANKAYEPVQKRIEEVKKRRERYAKYGPGAIIGHGLVKNVLYKGILRGVVKRGLWDTVIKGGIIGGTTAAAKGVWKRKVPIAIGVGLGLIVLPPLGGAIGGLIGGVFGGNKAGEGAATSTKKAA